MSETKHLRYCKNSVLQPSFKSEKKKNDKNVVSLSQPRNYPRTCRIYFYFSPSIATKTDKHAEACLVGRLKT